MGQPKKKVVLYYIFYTFLQIFGSKYQIAIATKIGELFQHLGSLHLTAHQAAQWWYGQKSKID